MEQVGSNSNNYKQIDLMMPQQLFSRLPYPFSECTFEGKHEPAVDLSDLGKKFDDVDLPFVAFLLA